MNDVELAQWLEETYDKMYSESLHKYPHKTDADFMLDEHNAWLLTARELLNRYSLVVDSNSLKEGIYALMQLAQNESMTDEFMWKKVEHFVDERIGSHFKEEGKT